MLISIASRTICNTLSEDSIKQIVPDSRTIAGEFFDVCQSRQQEWGRVAQANASHPLRGVPRPSFAWAGVFVPNRTPSHCGTTLPSTARGLKLDGAAAEKGGSFSDRAGSSTQENPRPSRAGLPHPSRFSKGG